MQLSPSIVPSDSNALAGIFPVGGPVAVSEGPGLAEPAGFAELMAALAPAPASAEGAGVGPVPPCASSAVPVSTQPQAATLVGGSVVRAPGRGIQSEARAPEAMEHVEGVAASTVEGEGEAVPSSPSTRMEPCEEAESQPATRAPNQERRRGLYEPVAGLETLIVPQVAATTVPAPEEDFAEAPAELDTEEAPLDEDGASSEEALAEAALPVLRALAAPAPSPVFDEIALRAEAVRSPVHSRATPGSAQAPAATLVAPAAAPDATSSAGWTAEGVEFPRAEAMAGEGTAALPVAGESREASVDSRRAMATPVAASSTPSVAAREVFTPVQTPAGETSAASLALRGAAPAAQPLAGELLARASTAAQPVKPAVAEPTVAFAVADQETGEEEVSAGSPGFAAAVATTMPREAISRAAAPRVAAAYATREKFAAERAVSGSERFLQDSSSKISFLNIDGEALEVGNSVVGIDVAKSNAVMPALPSPVTFASLAPGAVSVLDVASVPVREAPEVRAPEAVSNAGQAVEVVLRAVDTAVDREQKVVKLEFSVGDAALSVHVELAADEVRTTFRTESPELRAALAHEWQAVSTDSSDQGGVRLAPAVISDKEHSPSTSADANSQRQERHAARQEEASSSAQQAAARSLLRASTAAEASAAPVPAFRALAPAGTAQRLHLFA